MLKLTNTNSTPLVANQVIPLSVAKQTNNKISYSNNGANVNVGGLIDIEGMFTITATAVGSITIQLYNGTTPISGAKSTNSFTAIGDVKTFNLTDIEQVVNSIPSNQVNLNFVVSGACTMTNALATFSYMK